MEASARKYELGYRPALDGLRAIAILAVIAFHGWFLDGGFLGVDLFFVLSGALITMILAREQASTGAIARLRFYGRRALRLVPALVVMLVTVYLWLRLTNPGWADGAWWRMLVALFYVANVACAYVLSGSAALEPFSHTWTLATEEQFYLLWPALVPLLLRARRRTALTVLVVVFCAIGVLRAIVFLRGHHTAAYLGPIERSDGLVAGCIVGLLTMLGPSARLLEINRRLMPVAWLVLATAYVVATPRGIAVYLGGLSVVNLAAASIVLHVLHDPPRILETRPMVAIGKLSYGLYLYNFPVRLTVMALWPWPWLMLFQVVVTFVLAALSYWLVERPMLRLRDRPGRTRQAEGHASTIST